jgi:hypothetical protein
MINNNGTFCTTTLVRRTKSAGENDITSGYDVTSVHVTNVTSGHLTDVTSGHVTPVTSLPVAHISQIMMTCRSSKQSKY